MKKNNKIFLYGGKSTAYLVQEILLEKKKKTSYIFDKYLKKIHFETKAKFSNRKEDLIKFLNDSQYFFICIGMVDGKLRDILSKKIIKKKLKPISIISKDACIDNSVKYNHGLLAMPHAVVNKKTIIGSNCYLNVNSVIDHECIIEDGVHIMGSAYIAGRVTIKKYASIGANATVVCGHNLGEYCFIAAGAVVTKEVPAYALMAGTPAKRIGWMSKAGGRLGDDLICPIDGSVYRLLNPNKLEQIII